MQVHAGQVRTGAITNDIYTKEDKCLLTIIGAWPAKRTLGVETGGCPHTAIREDASINLEAIDRMLADFPQAAIVFMESGLDNFTAIFSRELSDLTIYVIDVTGGDKIPRKGGPSIIKSNLFVISFIAAHTDEEAVAGEHPQAITTTEVLSLSRIRSVSLTQVVARPERYRHDSTPTETLMTVGWGTVRHVDLEPAACNDPNCDADHGYTGTSTADDLAVRMSVAADGAENVAALVRFGTLLQQLTGDRR